MKAVTIKALTTGALLAAGLVHAGMASAQSSRPGGDFTVVGNLTVDNGVIDDFTCGVEMQGRARTDGTGLITAVKITNSQVAQAIAPLTADFCGGEFGAAVGFHGVLADNLPWEYEIDPVADTITIDDVTFAADPALGLPGCGPGTLVADWQNGDPDVADGDTRWGEIIIDQVILPGPTNNCELAPDDPQVLKVFFKVGLEVQ